MAVKTQVPTVFFTTQLNSEIKVGGDIGHCSWTRNGRHLYFGEEVSNNRDKRVNK